MPHSGNGRVRVLVVDPMPLARKALAQAFEGSMSVEIVAALSGAGPAGRRLETLDADLVVLDLQPPVEDELEQVCRLRARFRFGIVLFTRMAGRDLRVVVDALGVRPSAVVTKPQTNLVAETVALRPMLESAIRLTREEAGPGRLTREEAGPGRQAREEAGPGRQAVASPRPTESAGSRVIAVGASTGGTEAIATLLAALPRRTPGLVIVQHMPAAFTSSFARRLNQVGELEVCEAQDGDRVRPGRALLAPGAQQMRLARTADGYVVRVGGQETVNGHCPSVDVLMQSVAEQVRRHAVGVLLTGMGSDGALGMKAIRDCGGVTIGQDEATSVVYGMPRVAFLGGGVEHVAGLPEIAARLVALSGGS